MKIAVISDIHSNTLALKEVLKDIKTRKVDLIINLGDSLYGSIDPVGTAKLLIESDIISIAGNQDEIIIDKWASLKDNQSLEFVRSQLSDESILNWLGALPQSYCNDNIMAFHGTPESNHEYLLEDISSGRPVIKSEDELEVLLSSISQKIILCGHSHLPQLEYLKDKVIVNPGSVGLQAYFDDSPVMHYMQTCDPRASYALVELNEGNVDVKHYKVDYDYKSASKIAMQNERIDWAYPLLTGKAKEEL